jgi:hypothetical protein
MLDVGRSRFRLILTADYADNTDLTWNQSQSGNQETRNKAKPDESGNERKSNQCGREFPDFCVLLRIESSNVS